MSDNDQDWVASLSSTGVEQEAAIAKLQEILVRGVLAASSNRYGGRIQVDDVVQEALIQILNKLDTFEGKSKFTTWAMTIAIRIAISELRRKHYQDVSMSSLVEDSLGFDPVDPSDEATSEHDMTEQTQLLAKLRELIDTRLTTKQRDAMHAVLNGIPVEVYAEQTGSNRNAVYKLAHDARIRLREGLEEAGFNAFDMRLG